MSQRLKSLFFAFLFITVIWSILVLVYLPQAGNIGHWTTTHTEPTSEEAKFSSPTQIRRRSNVVQPPRRSDYFAHLGDKHRALTSIDTIYYDFNLNNYHQGQSNSTISQIAHNDKTLALATITNPADQYVKTEGQRLFSFNLLVSNRVGPSRSLPDTRNERCRKDLKQIDGPLLRASVIICYYNEAPSALLRTLYSVVERSPPELLQEIIVIDDHSDHDFHHANIKPLIPWPELVTLRRTNRREGLIRARLFGVELAKGDVLVFLDSHVEANIGWLEPLMDAVRANETTIACPMIDLIDSDTLVYKASPMVRGGLNWALNFKWDSVPSDLLKTYDDFVKPIDSPTMAGGLYAIQRRYFYHLGAYDKGMELWGGENIELSLRAWMCGGRIVILPCSRVGHIFRKRRPYGPKPDEPDSLLFNSHRTALVWMDEYIDRFYEASPNARELPDADVGQRKELRNQLGCQNFTWFLENVYPDLIKPVESNEKSSKRPNLFKVSRHQRDSRSAGSLIDAREYVPQRVERPSHSSSNSLGKKDDLNASKNDIKHWQQTSNSIARFQIQATGSNLCIESKSLLPAIGGFTRLVLDHCAEVGLDETNTSLAANLRVRGQMWTETEVHDYRLGEDQCLDLIKNLPLLRKCHQLGSFQCWLRDNQSSGANIYNSGGRLCLAVERLQLGEPIIVTLCDRRPTESISINSLDPRRLHNVEKSDTLAWQRLKMTHTRHSSNYLHQRKVPTPRVRPYQRWTLLFDDGPTSRTNVQSDRRRRGKESF